jgi:hypothetical protein
LVVAVDDKDKNAASFWSCLQDIQEGLQELNFETISVLIVISLGE